eukprot:g1854.t1
MVELRALLLGDVATLQFPSSICGHRGNDQLDGRKGLGYMLKQSFGKLSEVHPQPGLEPLGSFQRQATATATATSPGLQCLQLSLEEAFYLAHVDECLELAIRPLVFPATAATALPSLSPPRRKRRLGGENSHLQHDRPGHHHQGGADDVDAGTARVPKFGAGLGSVGTVGRGSTEEEAQEEEEGPLDGDDTAPPSLSSQEAWRYCCDRRPDFPAMFAVYRHFRARRYTVHTGHKYGTHFVLYEGSPEECHSRYCVHVAGGGGGGDSWGHMKTMTRLMPDVAKCLLVCGVRYQALQQQSSRESRSSSPLDTSSLDALAVAQVTALRVSRSREPDGGTVTRTIKQDRLLLNLHTSIGTNRGVSGDEMVDECAEHGYPK